MPRRTDIHTILIIGSGPIVIGQGCEFDYSGVQACRALREEGYRIVLINSNPATIMTDPEFADATYIEPITPEAVEKILKAEKEKGTPIDALLPTLGGQTGLNTGMACYDKGILQKYGVKMIGADREAIFRGEDRQRFKDLMISIGLKVPRSGVVHTMDEARKVMDDIGLPLIIRPAFTLGGTGGGIAYNVEEFETIVQRGLDASPVTEVLIEQSVIGWKEYEMEVMRDRNDNVVIICSIENVDPMGVHTGDSITVAPIQTLTDKEYQRMRDASMAVIRAVGVETGGSNIQFAIDPANGEMVVVEMNPRVSRSSALASKATGYPIAKIAAKLAVGYTLDELPNYITSRKRAAETEMLSSATGFPSSATPLSSSATGFPSSETGFPSSETGFPSSETGFPSSETGFPSSETGFPSSETGFPSSATGFPSSATRFPSSAKGGLPPFSDGSSSASVREDYEQWTSACFEPTIDYVVIKIPRWTFEKFPDADETLTTQMKSVGEAMAIGRIFKEALQKGIRSMEVKRFGFGLDKYDKWLKAEKAGTKARRHEGTKGSGQPLALPPTARADVLAGTPNPQLDDASEKTAHGEAPDQSWPIPEDKLRRKLAVPSQGRLYYIRYAMKMGWSIDRIYELTKIDKWFLAEMKELVDFERELQGLDFSDCDSTERSYRTLVRAKQLGYSDVQIATLCQQPISALRQFRSELGIKPVYKLVDTCAAEFEASTPYYYSTYETPYTHNGKPVVEDEIRLTDKPKVIIIGGGPNRIGQGIEFDYCCVHAAFAMRELGLESVMINSNPETVSTDYDTSDLLFFEPLTHEDILNICERLNGGPFGSVGTARHPDEAVGGAHPTRDLVKGVIVQFGGQTPLNLARGLMEAGVPILGTTVASLDAAGDREQFRQLLQKLGLKQPANGIARNVEEARTIARQIGYPVLVRPSFVLGGRAMEIVSDEAQLNHYMAHAVEASTIADAPILIDKFLDAATEVDVDCIADFAPAGSGQRVAGREAGEVLSSLPAAGCPLPTPQAIVIGVMEHIEEAGIHSGDSACALPPYSLPPTIVAELKRQTKELAKALRVCGLMNVQYAIKDGEIYVIEVNPRASRTVPFVGKATGVPWAKIAAKVMAGKTLAELGVTELPDPKHVSVKEVVFPFSKFPGVDVILGPEMRSTGEVMGIDESFDLAFAKSQIAAAAALPTQGRVFISVRDQDKQAVVPVAKALSDCGFELICTGGTYEVLSANGVEATRISKLAEGRPNIKDYIKNGEVQLIINTPTKKGPATDEGKIRALSVLHKVPLVTTLTGANAAARAIAAMQKGDWGVKPLQAYFGGRRDAGARTSDQ